MLIGKPLGKRPRHRWEDCNDNTVDLNEISCENVNRINLAWDSVKMACPWDHSYKCSGSVKVKGKSMTRWATIRFSRRTLCFKVSSNTCKTCSKLVQYRFG
jgi:hypothetical protein